MKLLKFLYGITGLVVFLILVWLFTVPNELIQQKMEDAVSRSGNGSMALSVEGLRKGVFFSLYADALDLSIDNEPAVRINDVSINFTPRYLTNGEPAFIVKGLVGTGTIEGVLKPPMKGEFNINEADLDAIPYFKKYGMSVTGHLSSDISMNNEKAEVVFNIPDLHIQSSAITSIPLLSSFRRIQGSVSLNGNDITVDSISLEGEKGFARLKGRVRNGYADMILQLMPVEQSLTALESMVIGKYIVSPGYYEIPLNGPLAVR